MKYNSFIFVLVIAILSAKVAANIRQEKHFCAAESCGELLIEYPFGKLGTTCSYNKFFTVTCNSTSSRKPKLFLAHYNLEIVKINTNLKSEYGFLGGDMIVNIPVRTCEGTNKHQHPRWRLPSFDGLSIRYDMDNNVFAFVGCEGEATLHDDEGTVVASCNSTCTPAGAVIDRCDGYYCCQKDLTSSNSASSIEISMSKSDRCQSAFLLSRTFVDANATVTVAMGSSAAPTQLQWIALFKMSSMGLPFLGMKAGLNTTYAENQLDYPEEDFRDCDKFGRPPPPDWAARDHRRDSFLDRKSYDKRPISPPPATPPGRGRWADRDISYSLIRVGSPTKEFHKGAYMERERDDRHGVGRGLAMSTGRRGSR